MKTKKQYTSPQTTLRLMAAMRLMSASSNNVDNTPGDFITGE